MRMIANLVKQLFIMAIIMVVTVSAVAKAPQTVELTGVNTYVFSNEINAVTTDEFISALIGKRAILDNVDPKATLYIVIVSGGGEYYNAVLMKELIAKVSNVTLICKYCASAAGFIFGTTSVPRLAIKKSIVLMHEMYIPKLTANNAKNPALLNSLIKDSDAFNLALYSKIGISKEEYEKKIINKEWTLYGEDVVKYKLADKLVTIHCDGYVKQLAPDTCSQEETTK